ncbi:protein RTF1 homolog [Neltuma alba]|uniref:protein RTF1 homolog n=1 Tax=Neltuma alba TaxID=207710 RepID=UPI0010A2CC24|nr:protein RTF1 homolog [Prosopis alba]
MADLENMLLEAAGRTGSPVKKRHTLPKSSFKGEGSYSDGGSESRDEDSDDDDAHASTKKPSRSQSHVPLKKRLDPTKRPPQQHDHDNGDGGALGGDDAESSNESDVGSDLYKNEDDKQRLAKMTELEREMILSDRAAKKGEKEFKEQLRLKKMDNAKSSQPSRKSEAPSSLPSSAKVRSSARYAEKTASKGDALSELRAKRMKQQSIHVHGKTSKSKALRTNSTGQGVSSGRRKLGVKASSSSSSQSESMIRSDSDRESSGPNGLADSDDDRNMTGSEVPTFDDIHEITLRRSKLAKWLNEPFFDELIVGCFVRIGIGKSDHGPVYRLCMIQSVDASTPDRQYKIENRVTHKRLICVWGSENSAARFQISVVSDSAPLEKEYRQWVREIEKTCSQMPSKQDVAVKREAIRKTNTYIYSAATVKQMLEEKKARPLNVAVEKDRLKNQLEIARSNHNEEEVDRIYTRLQELEATRQARDNDARAKRLAEMNKKNKVENFKNLSELKRVTGNLKVGEDGYDPFSRRWTRSRNYYAAEHGESNEAKQGEKQKDESKKGDNSKEVREEQEAGGTTKVGVRATEAALQAAADAGKLIDTVAPVDHGTETNMLHDFELPISLAALQKFGGPQGLKNGFLARKQQVEATVGCQVPENDGNRHVLTLTISDYKRRRGLL